jgi:hypothetical protein
MEFARPAGASKRSCAMFNGDCWTALSIFAKALINQPVPQSITLTTWKIIGFRDYDQCR